jgi:hypothetical protein
MNKLKLHTALSNIGALKCGQVCTEAEVQQGFGIECDACE